MNDTRVYFGNKVAACIRGHQHSGETLPLIRKQGGVLSHWHVKDKDVFSLTQGMVLTFSLGGDSQVCSHAHIDFSTYGILTLKGAFNNWEMEVIRQSIR